MRTARFTEEDASAFLAQFGNPDLADACVKARAHHIIWELQHPSSPREALQFFTDFLSLSPGRIRNTRMFDLPV
jgi:hypothetical protein